MTTTASSLVQRAADLLMDKTSTRWSVAELVRWLNDGQREMAVYRPDEFNVTVTATLPAGARQDLGALSLAKTPIKLTEVTRNMANGSSMGAIRLTPRNVLDAFSPGWTNGKPSISVVNYTYDAREQRVFFVYPPSNGSAQVELTYSAYPTPVAEPAPGSLYSDVAGNVDAPDILVNALLDYMVFRALSKDADFGNPQAAAPYYASFANALGIEIKATLQAGPQVAPGEPVPPSQ